MFTRSSAYGTLGGESNMLSFPSLSTIRLTKNQWIGLGIGACVLGLILLFLTLPNPKITVRESATPPNPANGGAPRLLIPEAEQIIPLPPNFYGVVKDKRGNSLQVALLEPQPNSPPIEGRMVAVETNEQTEYFFQKEIIGDGTSYFVPERAERKDLKKGLYLFIESPQGSGEIARVTFSDKNPF